LKTPKFSTGASLALADVFDAASSSFVAPRAGLYSLGYTLYLGMPFWVKRRYSGSYNVYLKLFSGAAEMSLVVDGVSQLITRFDGDARTFDQDGFPKFPVLNRYYSDSGSSTETVTGSRQYVRGGTWTGYLAAGAKVSAELTFRGYTYFSDLGLLWVGSRLRFSCIVPY
jgi:hypothetical protein